MEYISKFVITLVITMIFITAVDIIAPDNAIKKYIKFVLGLILISVMINPIIYFFTQGESQVVNTIKSYENSIYEEFTKESTDNIDAGRIKAFKENLNKNCDSMLKSEFSDKNFKSSIECTLDFKDMTYAIDKIEVGVEEDGVKIVEKIKIGIDESEETISNEMQIENESEIKNYLSEVFKVPLEKISLYSIGG